MKYFITMLFLFCFVISNGQEAKLGKYWVSFTDKDHSHFSILQPQQFLSPRAIERRKNQSIPIVENDLPVSSKYIESVNSTGAKVLNTSKWLNGATILASSDMVDEIQHFSFIQEVFYVGKDIQKKKEETFLSKIKINKIAYPEMDNIYGYGKTSIEMINGHALHELGFKGQNKMIAILDGGFTNTDLMPFFDRLRYDGRLIEGWDFVDNDDYIYESSSHGSQVLSVMGADLPGLFTGTAPKATYVLIKTEDTRGEYLFEECNWIAGVEYADSMGVDIINSSLGYTTFSDDKMNYGYKDMDGRTSLASKAADIAFSKGMMIVSSAGNSGNSSWRYIGTPADARGVLAVGATDRGGERAMFSSFGPTSDGRVKPNVAALGQGIPVASIYSYNVFESNGTSFSAPLIAGAVAALWQAFPTKTSQEIFQAIEDSGNNKDALNYDLGHGIPDFWAAYQLLASDSHQAVENDDCIVAYQNETLEIPLHFETVVKDFELVIKNANNTIVYSEIVEEHNKHFSTYSVPNCRLDANQFYTVSIITKAELNQFKLKIK